MNKSPGHLVISLDLELFWGMFDKESLESYGPNVFGERTAIPRLLRLFERYGIHATWATVGLLMARDKNELEAHLPPLELRPTYENRAASAYEYLATIPIGNDETTDPYHYGPSLVKLLLESRYQKIANHTFSHFYCVDGKENGPEIFAADLLAHKKIAETYGITTNTIVFPRNQWSTTALRVCFEHDLRAYRGNEDHFLYRARKDTEQTLFVRGLRLLDHYLNLSGHHTYPLPTLKPGELINIPAGRFFRPFMRTLAWLEPLRLRRIKNSMTYAAKRGEVFHLWWHPHNFGLNQEENFRNLETLLTHFEFLKNTYGMQSASMEDIVTLVTSPETLDTA